jgi:uncharacterized protein YndB with AHSA1/START domain
MTRVFDAPRSLVFDALTNSELVRQRLPGPPGRSMPVCEIVPPERFPVTESFKSPMDQGVSMSYDSLADLSASLRVGRVSRPIGAA